MVSEQCIPPDSEVLVAMILLSILDRTPREQHSHFGNRYVTEMSQKYNKNVTNM